MNLFGAPTTWQQHCLIEQAMLAYYDLELRFPVAARMVHSGEINSRLKERAAFKDGDDLMLALERPLFEFEPRSAEAELQDIAWETLARAIVAAISAIFYASRTVGESRQRDSGEAVELLLHGERAITVIVNRSWRTLKRRWITNLILDKSLEAFVQEMIERHVASAAEEEELEKATPEDSEHSNA